MNDLEAAHSVEPAPTSPPSPEEAIAAPITVYSRRETDEAYEGVIARSGDLRIVNCPDDIQWIVQRFTGGQWRNKSFHRSRHCLVRRYGALEMILALPERHDGDKPLIDSPHCNLCGRWKCKPRGGLPRHMFCLEARKRPQLPLGYQQGICGMTDDITFNEDKPWFIAFEDLKPIK
jgi:hypothetical protein